MTSIWLTSITSVTSFRFSAVGRVAQQPQPFFAEALEAVRRAARLERAAAEDLRARARTAAAAAAHLRFALRRARAGHDDHLVAADAHVADRDHGAVRLERPARELVRLRDAQHLVDAVQHLDQRLVGMPLADRAEHRARDAGRPVHVHPHFDQPRDDVLDLRLAGAFFHYNDHGFCCLPTAAVIFAGLDRSPVLSCTTRRSRLRASSMMRSNSRAIASGPSGPSAAMPRTCASTCFSRSGLIDLDALLLLQPPDLARAPRALVQQPDEHFVHPVDVVAADRQAWALVCSRRWRSSATARRPRLSMSSRRFPFASAISDTSALPTTAASA